MGIDEILDNIRGSLEQAQGSSITHVDTIQLHALLSAYDKLVETLCVGTEHDSSKTAQHVEHLHLHLTPEHEVTCFPEKVMHVRSVRTPKSLWEAILKFWSYEDHDRCHDIENEFFMAVGLPPKGKPKCTRAECEQGCRDYAEESTSVDLTTEAPCRERSTAPLSQPPLPEGTIGI